MSASGTATAAPSAAQLVGTIISDRYKVESVLGSGGMGAVFLVQHIHMRKRFALKMLHAETSKNPEIVARFEREAMAAANVDHPNIAVASDFGRAASGAFFLVLEYLEGKTLHAVLDSGPLPLYRAVHIARQVASALERSHQLSIIHRDLKPENIMLISRPTDRNFVKVLDFGLAKVVAQSLPAGGGQPGPALTKQGSIFGTPKYMAPEQCVSGPTDGRTDLYALGLILYEMLTGQHPFDGKDAISWIGSQLSVPVPTMKLRAPQVSIPSSLEALVMRLLEKQPEQRYQSATELLRALDEVAEKEHILAPAPLPPLPTSTPGLALPPKAAENPGETVSAADLLSVVGTEMTPAAAVPPTPRRAPGPVARPPAVDLATRLTVLLGRLPAPVQKRPVLLLLPLLLLPLGLLVFGRSPTPTTVAPQAVRQATPASAARATQAQYDAAIGGGLPALLSLAQQYPEDARVLRSIAHTYMAQKNGAEALRWQARVILINKNLIPEGELLQATMMALSDHDAMESSIGLLETALGSRGVDILYSLSVRPGPSRIKLRVQQSLAKPTVLAQASAAVAIAIKLHAVDGCEATRALLPQAAQVADARALSYLRALTQVHNCGPYGMLDCWSCLRQDGGLAKAISAIEARSPAP